MTTREAIDTRKVKAIKADLDEHGVTVIVDDPSINDITIEQLEADKNLGTVLCTNLAHGVNKHTARVTCVLSYRDSVTEDCPLPQVLINLEDLTEEMCRNTVYPTIAVGDLTGKMSAARNDTVLDNPEISSKLSDYIDNWVDANRDRISSFDADALSDSIQELDQLSLDATSNSELRMFADNNPNWIVVSLSIRWNDDRNMLIRADGNARITAYNRNDSMQPGWTSEYRTSGSGDNEWLTYSSSGNYAKTIDDAVTQINECNNG